MPTSQANDAHYIFCRRTTTTLIILAAMYSCVPGNAQGIPNQSLVDLIVQQKIVSPKQNIKAIVAQTSATITTERSEKDDDNACKLRAILMAKCVFESQPSSIQKTIVVFLDYNTNAADTVTIKRAEINEFGQGKLTESALLASIDFEKSGGASEQSTVASGDMQAQREMLLDRITRMKAKGTNVSAFMNIFNEIEKLAQSDDKAKLKERCEYLSDKVLEQERMLKEAQSNAHIQGGRSQLTSGSTGAQPLMNSSGPALPGDLADALAAAGLADPFVMANVAKYRMLLMVVNRQADLRSLDDVIRTRNRENILNYMKTLQPKK